MKKLITILTSLLALTVSLNAQSTPELLKEKSSFSDYKKFESPEIYVNMQANADLVAQYEANPSAFKDEELFPVIMSYMSLRNIDKGEELLLKHIKVAPNNAAALRNLASVNMIRGKNDEGIAYYQKAAATGDILGLKSLASAYVITQQSEKIKDLIPQLEGLAKTDLEAANILLIYALSENVNDKAYATKVISSINVDEALKAPKVEALNSSFNLYLNNKELWTGEAILIPARVAVLRNLWVIANETLDIALKANPNNALALKSKALVEYRTGDIAAAFNYINKAIATGDNSAYNDYVELAIGANVVSRIKDKLSSIAKQDLSTRSNFLLIRYGLTNNDADTFFLGALGKNSEILYSNEQNKLVISEGLKKFSSDSRTKKVQALLK